MCQCEHKVVNLNFIMDVGLALLEAGFLSILKGITMKQESSSATLLSLCSPSLAKQASCVWIENRGETLLPSCLWLMLFAKVLLVIIAALCDWRQLLLHVSKT